MILADVYGVSYSISCSFLCTLAYINLLKIHSVIRYLFIGKVGLVYIAQ